MDVWGTSGKFGVESDVATDLNAEILAEVREHWKGPFQFGALDMIVVNMTKDTVWVRDGVVPMREVSMRFYRFFAWLFILWPLMIAPAWSVAQPKTAKAPHIEPQAVQVLKQMTNYLKELQQFSVQAEITEDVLLDSGLTIQDGRSVTASVRRPNRLRVDSLGDPGRPTAFLRWQDHHAHGSQQKCIQHHRRPPGD